MSESVHKKIEIVGTSATSIEEAIQNALERAGRTLHGLEWFEVVEQRGRIDGNRVSQFQVTLKVGFKLE